MELSFDFNNTRVAIGVFDRVTINEVSYKHLSANEVGVTLQMADGTGRAIQFSHQEMSRLASVGRIRVEPNYYHPDKAVRQLQPSTALLSALPPKLHARVAKRSAYVEAFFEMEREGKINRTDAAIEANMELLSGKAMKFAGNLNPLAEDEQGASTDLRIAPSTRTLRKWVKAAELDGETGFLDAVHLRGNRNRLLGPEEVGLLMKKVRGYLDRERPTIKAIHEEVQKAFEERNTERQEQGLPGLKVPSRETTRRAIRTLDPFAVIAARFGTAAARKRFKPVLSGLDLTRPLQRVEMDEWDIDLMTLMHSSGLIDLFTEEERFQLGLDKTSKRWTLTVAICCTTRCIVGLVISPKPKARAAVQTLQMVVSNKGQWADAVGALSHWDMHGTPELVVTDCGAAFKSQAFRFACADLGITKELAIAGCPEVRGTIERVFNTIALSLLPRLSGRTFSDVVSKGDAKPEDRAALTLDDLVFVLVRWIVDIYHNTEHRGLGGDTPAARWRCLSKEWGVRPSPDMRRSRLVFGRRMTRVLSKEGLTVLGVRYHSERLADWMLRMDKCEVDLRWHPKDIGAIEVRLGSDWFTIPAIDHELDGVPAPIWLSATRDVRARNPKASRISTDVIRKAIKAISERNADAMALAGLVVEDWSPERIQREEKRLFRGVKFGEAKALQQTAGGLGRAFPGAEGGTGKAVGLPEQRASAASRKAKPSNLTIEED
ncbi:Mu transposase C-terminal domain-containing protein (plasmid) [Leisingera aquaemixtae]|uniref:Mu transposase C-terminal domain-containing protein n=1 Tax=Leisingera aquaemixtae TaxID=1396826 RepID=UPI0039841E02